MSYYHRQTRLCYLANPRTASRATASALQDVGFVKMGSHHGHDRETAWARRAVTFTTVRAIGPTLTSWARHWRFKYPEIVSRRALIERLEGQRAIIEGWESWTLFPWAREADHILHYEALTEELNAFLGARGFPELELPIIR